uniref:Protein brunelleschi n=2 Tax=Aceria tosichella TaxID=561515 RepID=A0A6G1SND8_9ACAR
MNINFRGQRLLPNYDFLQTQSDSRPIKVLVHEFIQSVVFTPFPQDSELQVERLILAGNIYESIGFKRKAAFYRRFAALKSVTVQSNWQACYDALLGSLDGFGLTLDPIEYEKALSDKCSSVWPGLHVQLIEELITCCKKIQNGQAGTLAIRHMSFMLHTLDFHLSAAKKRECAKDLEEASTIFGEDSPVPLKLSSGYVIPTVNLTKYPLCLKLEPVPLPMSLRPVRLVQLRRRSMMTPTSEARSDNPFIFTPISNHNSMSVFETRRTSSNSLITDIVWAQDEPCSTVMVLKNTLPFDLRVTSIKLLTDGVPLETKPSSLKLEPNMQTTIQLIGIPRQLPRTTDDSDQTVSRLEIFGYSTHLLGVKSNCRLDMIPKSKFPSQYIVDIAPPLPRIEFQFPEDLPDFLVDPIPSDQVDKDLIVMEVTIEMKLGDQLDTQLSVLNSSNVDVEYLFIKEKQQRTIAGSEKIITLDEQLIDALCLNPLKASEKIAIPVRIEACRNLFSNTKSLSTTLTFEYSGGLALKEMYCRKCAIRFIIDIKEEEEEKKEVIDDEIRNESTVKDLSEVLDESLNIEDPPVIAEESEQE